MNCTEKARINVPGALYHIIGLGIDRRIRIVSDWRAIEFLAVWENTSRVMGQYSGDSNFVEKVLGGREIGYLRGEE